MENLLARVNMWRRKPTSQTHTYTHTERERERPNTDTFSGWLYSLINKQSDELDTFRPSTFPFFPFFEPHLLCNRTCIFSCPVVSFGLADISHLLQHSHNPPKYFALFFFLSYVLFSKDSTYWPTFKTSKIADQKKKKKKKDFALSLSYVQTIHWNDMRHPIERNNGTRSCCLWANVNHVLKHGTTFDSKIKIHFCDEIALICVTIQWFFGVKTKVRNQLGKVLSNC